MLRRALPVCALLTIACGRTITTSASTQSRLAPPEAYKCVTKQLDTLKFQRVSHDDDELRVTARKVNPEITFSSPTFRKTWDRIEAQVVNAPTGTALDVRASTVAEYFTQIGPTFNQLSTSKEAKQAAETVLQRCSAPAMPVPAPAPPSGTPGPQ
jgi:hypothetical protein